MIKRVLAQNQLDKKYDRVYQNVLSYCKRRTVMKKKLKIRITMIFVLFILLAFVIKMLQNDFSELPEMFLKCIRCVYIF